MHAFALAAIIALDAAAADVVIALIAAASVSRPCNSTFYCGVDRSRADRFCQNKHIARSTAPAFVTTLVRVDNAGNCVAKFHLLIVDRVSANDNDTRLDSLLACPPARICPSTSQSPFCG